MKTKAKFILKSLADLPANTLALATSVPAHALQLSKDALTPPVRATRRQIRAARQGSQAFMHSMMIRANAPFQKIQPWSHGGLNE